MAVSQAAFTFIYRFMANKSAEYPEGVLNKQVLKSFMSITGSDSNVSSADRTAGVKKKLTAEAACLDSWP
jgi:hypothetical protein